MILANERSLVRELARKVAEIAISPESKRIQKRWRDVNALRKPDRAPVLCRPIGCWSEIFPPESLGCKYPWLREWEMTFRQALHKHEMCG